MQFREDAKMTEAPSVCPDKQDKLTKESWTEDGWFKTGDVGQWNKVRLNPAAFRSRADEDGVCVTQDGTLSVIDRKKNLVKLAGGEYIALERLEYVVAAPSLAQSGCGRN
jgi:long-chain acyl-CoA synthetase